MVHFNLEYHVPYYKDIQIDETEDKIIFLYIQHLHLKDFSPNYRDYNSSTSSLYHSLDSDFNILIVRPAC